MGFYSVCVQFYYNQKGNKTKKQSFFLRFVIAISCFAIFHQFLLLPEFKRNEKKCSNNNGSVPKNRLHITAVLTFELAEQRNYAKIQWDVLFSFSAHCFMHDLNAMLIHVWTQFMINRLALRQLTASFTTEKWVHGKQRTQGQREKTRKFN